VSLSSVGGIRNVHFRSLRFSASFLALLVLFHFRFFFSPSLSFPSILFMSYTIWVILISFIRSLFLSFLLYVLFPSLLSFYSFRLYLCIFFFCWFSLHPFHSFFALFFPFPSVFFLVYILSFLSHFSLLISFVVTVLGETLMLQSTNTDTNVRRTRF
jgi:hypothetical protein